MLWGLNLLYVLMVVRINSSLMIKICRLLHAWLSISHASSALTTPVMSYHQTLDHILSSLDLSPSTQRRPRTPSSVNAKRWGQKCRVCVWRPSLRQNLYLTLSAPLSASFLLRSRSAWYSKHKLNSTTWIIVPIESSPWWCRKCSSVMTELWGVSLFYVLLLPPPPFGSVRWGEVRWYGPFLNIGNLVWRAFVI